jgi:serine/threonine-protein kinase
MSDRSSTSAAGRDNPSDIVGRMAGEYRLRRKLGEGGFGAVYEAEHPVLKRRAAVKVLHQAAGRDSDAVLRFIAEAQAVNQIRNRYIVDIFSFGELPDGRHFYVMDLLEGEPLDRSLARLGRFELPAVVQLLRPIAEALDTAHDAGIVHRDIKPQNIFLTWDASGDTVPKLLDFGMAKLLADSTVHTQSGTPMGTPLYMSPEQARGEKVDGRSDVYSLGILCHELVTGRLPITGESTIAALMAQVLQPPPRASEVCPDLPSAIDAPILNMLEKQPAARPATAGAAIAALAAAVAAGQEIPPGMPRIPRPAPPPKPPEDESLPTALTERSPGRQDSAARSSEVATAARGGRPGGRPGRWLLALAGVTVVAAGVAVLKLSSPERSAAEPGSGAVPSLAPAPSAVAAPPAPAQPPLRDPARGAVDVTVRGAPAGARVWAGDRLLGEAPGPVAIAFGAAPVTLTVTAAGHEPATVTVVPNHALEVTVALGRRATRRESRARAPGPPAAREDGKIPSDLESPF